MSSSWHSRDVRTINTTDYHTAGEPFRIVADPPQTHGSTVAERRWDAIGNLELDGLRRLLCFEPRGHADMYGCFVTEPDDDKADFGALFWHKDGFSTACGHGTIALGVWAVQTGRVPRSPSGITPVVIDVPSGRVRADVHTDGETVTSVDFVSVASYVLHTGVPVAWEGRETIADIAFGGAIYAQVRASDLGLAVDPAQIADLTAAGRAVKWSLDGSDVAVHPSDHRLSGIYGTILYDDLGVDGNGDRRQRNVTVFADGEVDRSPCGSGTAARVATLWSAGELGDGQALLHDSIVSTQFVARVVDTAAVAGRPAAVPSITGMAYRTGEHVFVVDPDDPISPGFVLR
jgi:proline racemase